MPPAAGKRNLSLTDRALWLLFAATSFCIPLAVLPSGKDSFRLPKELLLEGMAVLLVLLAVLAAIWTSWRPPLPLRHPAVILTALIVSWAAFSAIFSTNTHLSGFSVFQVISLAAFFLAGVWAISHQRFVPVLAVLIVPALINVAVSSLQELEIWNPFRFNAGLPSHMRSTGLVGNPNDVGAYLVAPVIAVFCWLMISKRRARPAALLLFLLAGLVLNRTLTALIATAAGVLVLAWSHVPRPRRPLAVAVIVIVSIITVMLFPPLRQRAERVAELLEGGRYDDIVSGRLPAYAAAVEMVRERPLTGMGPGTFGYHYYPFRLRAEQRHPSLLSSQTRMQNFGEAHNDHLEVTAEGGLPAYALMLSALVYVGSLSRRRSGDLSDGDICNTFARTLALPLTISFAILMLAQFPLQLAVPAVSFLYTFALCVAWRRA